MNTPTDRGVFVLNVPVNNHTAFAATDSPSNPKTCLLYTKRVNTFSSGRLFTMSYSTVLVQNNWGVHLNFEGYFSRM